ncbi:hypothetical protein O7632_14215 [Solwaraspora sp. WMMD406]|uniref:hypothetical protein n=1 Tax=Solwaraspora sp. WMMD406 TaxID=3016095 RepID=UPI002417A477|nr:hypothetical protein [Solwaraspora sp. WMMD406]MDG4765241.1 hypothetical protein [Solwaraspora sp. WMMD406]
MAPTTTDEGEVWVGQGRPGIAVVGLILLLALASLGGCQRTGEDDAVTLQKDTQLSEQIQQIQQGGEPRLLRDLTGGDWDTVHVFHEPVSREYVEETVGASIDMGSFFSTRGHILIFLKDGQVQRAIYTTPNNLIAGQYGPQVRLQSRAEPGSTKLDLIEP